MPDGTLAPARARGGIVIVALAAALMTMGCGRGDANDSGAGKDHRWSPAARGDVRGVPILALRAAIQQRLAEARPDSLDAEQWKQVRALYAYYGGAPLWLGNDGIDERRVAPVSRAIVDAHTDGMRLDAYPLTELVRRIQEVKRTDRPTAEQLAGLDVLLSSAYAAVGRDLLTGQIDPRTVSQSWHIDPRGEEIDSALVRTLSSRALDRSMAAMRPQGEGYEGLRRELARYRDLASRGGWPPVDEGEALKPGDSAAPSRLTTLRTRLAAEGLLDDGMPAPPSGAGVAPAPAVYDRSLAGAVARFQARHAIASDSILGEETVRSMNLPVTYRLGQIAANMERYRWLPRALGDRYVLVNVPAFRLRAYENGRPVVEMKVIVGAEYENRATPVFSDSMQYVIFRPYWLVPDNIAAREILPRAESDPGYFASHDYELYRSEGRTRVRQRPGERNALGLVKFIFPNDFGIYLHDTPEDRLFEEDVRAFSHGCIRVEKPVQLAEWVLGWPVDSVENVMHSARDDDRVELPAKIPVYIVYFTAYVSDGELRFANDLYRRDDQLVSAVAHGSSSAESLRASQELMRLTH